MKIAWKINLLLSIAMLFIVFFAVGCQEEENFTPIPNEEVMKALASGQSKQFLFLPYFNQEGLPLSAAESQLLNKGKMSRTYYRNAHGAISHVKCHGQSQTRGIQDVRFYKLLNTAPLRQIELLNIDCSESNMELLGKMTSEGQPSISERARFLKFEDESHETVVVSIIELCGFPFREETVETAWQTMMYSSIPGLRELYYADFKEAYEKNLLSREKFMALEDKITRNKTFAGTSTFEFDSNSYSKDSIIDFLQENEIALSDINLQELLINVENQN